MKNIMSRSLLVGDHDLTYCRILFQDQENPEKF